jgi:hypothetical protein
MPYSEIHFNSAIVTDQIKFSGTRGRRVLELNCPLQINRFHVKDLELPLTFCNIARGSFQITYTVQNALGNLIQLSAVLEVPEGCYTGASFKATLQDLIRTAKLTSELPGYTNRFLSLTQVLVTTTDTGLLQFAKIHQFEGDMPLAIVDYQYIKFSITWSEELKSLVSRAYDDYSLTRTTSNNYWTSKYPLRLVPNYVYLHSNLMSGVSFNSVQRAIGSYHSKTIVTKIPLDTTYAWQASIMPWKNTSLSSELMFELGASSEFNQLEFWFTDENGVELDFQNVNFSLTLAVIYR